MIEEQLLPITLLKENESGTIRMVEGGPGVARRLRALGVKEGKNLKKVSSMFMRGPITVKVGHTQLSLGYGMATKVMIGVKR